MKHVVGKNSATFNLMGNDGKPYSITVPFSVLDGVQRGRECEAISSYLSDKVLAREEAIAARAAAKIEKLTAKEEADALAKRRQGTFINCLVISKSTFEVKE